VARAYTAAREVFEMRDLWAQIEALDNRVPAPMQYAMLYETGRLLRRLSYWLLMNRPALSIEAAVSELRGPVRDLTAHLAGALCGQWRSGFDAVLAHYVDAGVPAGLATRMGLLDAHNSALDLVELASASKVSITDAAQVYFGLGVRLGLDWLHSQIEALHSDGNWQAVARAGLRNSLFQSQRLLTREALSQPGRSTPAGRIETWVTANASNLAQWERMQADMRTAGKADFATLSVGTDALRRLAG
jgi:glutamate dehydrogenase